MFSLLLSRLVQAQLSSYFPTLISYERFMARIPRLSAGLFLLLKWLVLKTNEQDIIEEN